MAQDIFTPSPNLVKVTRRPQGPGDTTLVEHFVGLLVDVEGNHVETPEVGVPIYLSGDESDLPWLFASDPVYRIEVWATHWLVVTEKGNQYEITREREYQ